MKKYLFALVIAAVCAGAVPAQAASPWTEADSYGEQVTEKLAFGFENFLGGWTALFSTPMEAYENDTNVLKAWGCGLYKSVAYTVGGLLHIATAPVPVDVPLPDNGVDIG